MRNFSGPGNVLISPNSLISSSNVDPDLARNGECSSATNRASGPGFWERRFLRGKGYPDTLPRKRCIPYPLDSISADTHWWRVRLTPPTPGALMGTPIGTSLHFWRSPGRIIATENRNWLRLPLGCRHPLLIYTHRRDRDSHILPDFCLDWHLGIAICQEEMGEMVKMRIFFGPGNVLISPNSPILCRSDGKSPRVHPFSAGKWLDSWSLGLLIWR